MAHLFKFSRGDLLQHHRGLGHQNPSDLTLPEDRNYTYANHSVVDQYPPHVIKTMPSQGSTHAKITFIRGSSMLVKWGTNVRFAECQTSLYAQLRLHDKGIPIPKFYAWKTEGSERFLYLELFTDGRTLEDLIGSNELSKDDIKRITKELREWMHTVHHSAPVKYHPLDRPGEQHDLLYDQVVPFVGQQSSSWKGHKEFIRDTLMPYFKDHFQQESGPFYFSHGDVSPQNIWLRKIGGRWTIKGIYDWGNAGWYHEGYEEARMRAMGGMEGFEM